MFGRKIIKELNLILDVEFMTFYKVMEFYKKPIKLVVHVVSNYIMLCSDYTHTRKHLYFSTHHSLQVEFFETLTLKKNVICN